MCLVWVKNSKGGSSIEIKESFSFMKPIVSSGTKKVCIAVVILAAIFWLIFLIPSIFGVKVYAVASGSMKPQYQPGSLIFTKEVEPEGLSVGDCITFRQGKNTVTHRITAINGSVLTTKGDSNSAFDPPVYRDEVIGMAYDFSLPALGYFVMLINTGSLSFLLCLLVFIELIILIYDVDRLLKYRGGKINEEST